MTQDKDILENLEFLDKILNFLIHDCKSYSCGFGAIYYHMFIRSLDEDNRLNALGYLTLISEFNSIPTNEDNSEAFSMSDNTRAEGEKLVEACYYLNQHNYIRLDAQFNIKITFEGILKINDNFTSNYQRKLSDSERMLSIAHTQLTQNGQIVEANKQIAKLTFWIMVGALVAIVYQVVDLLKTFFPSYFPDAP
jgi:hypothetical protein